MPLPTNLLDYRRFNLEQESSAALGTVSIFLELTCIFGMAVGFKLQASSSIEILVRSSKITISRDILVFLLLCRSLEWHDKIRPGTENVSAISGWAFTKDVIGQNIVEYHNELGNE